MDNLNKWRTNADKLLAAPVLRKRSMTTVAGRVEDRFEAIVAARQRGMAWKDIAAALENGDGVKVDAVESAFKRICAERGITPPARARVERSVHPTRTPKDEPVPAPQVDLFVGAEERWVDDGE
jgi:hypothetical protein